MSPSVTFFFLVIPLILIPRMKSDTNSEMNSDPPSCPAKCDMMKEIDVLRGEMQNLRQLLNQESQLRMNLDQNIQSANNKMENIFSKIVLVNQSLLDKNVEIKDAVFQEMDNFEQRVNVLIQAIQNSSNDNHEEITIGKKNINDLQAKLLDTQLMAQNLENKANALNQTIQSSSIKIYEEISRERKSISDIQGKLIDTQLLAQNFGQKVNVLNQTIQISTNDIHKEITQGKKAINDLEGNLLDTLLLAQSLNESIHNKGTYVAFSATNAKLVSGKVVFGSVTSNLGNAYSRTTGTFTVPYTGVYAFFWTIATDNKKNCDTDLSINNSSSHKNMVQAGDIDEDTTGSQSLIKHLNRYDVINIRQNNQWYDCKHIHAEWSSFSGFRYV